MTGGDGTVGADLVEVLSWLLVTISLTEYRTNKEMDHWACLD